MSENTLLKKEEEEEGGEDDCVSPGAMLVPPLSVAWD